MKKHIVIILTTTFLFTFSSIFYACTQEEPTAGVENTVDLDNFEEDIVAVFKVVNEDIKQISSGRKLKLNNLFFQAVREVFPSSTTSESFQTNYVSAQKPDADHQQKNHVLTPLQELIASVDDAKQAIQVLEARLTSDEFSLKEKQQFIVMKESLIFLTINSNVLSEFMYYSGGKNNSFLTKCGWWESWGACAAGTLGGALTGGLGGCVAGATAAGSTTVAAGPVAAAAGATAGCIIGGVVGAVAGGLTGAAASCDGCEN